MTVLELRQLLAPLSETDEVTLIWQGKDFSVEVAATQPTLGLRLSLEAEKKRSF